MTAPDPVRIGLIGAGRIGTHHATTLARHLHQAELVAVADLFAAPARRLGEELGVGWLTNPQALIDDPRVEAVAITCGSTAHTDLVVAAARAGKAVFVEKPMAMTLADADRAIGAAEAAGIPLQVGFNRRFARDFTTAHEAVSAGRVGTPQLLRSLTRDPGARLGIPSRAGGQPTARCRPRWRLLRKSRPPGATPQRRQVSVLRRASGVAMESGWLGA